MRKLIFLILLLPLMGKAQDPAGLPQEMNFNWYRFNKYVSVELGLAIPARDTNWTANRAGYLVRKPSDGVMYMSNGNTTGIKWVAVGTGGGGSGTVTSVALSLPTEFSVSGSPVTTSGTLTGSWATQSTNKVFAAPNGSTGIPTFRLLVSADIPALAQSKITDLDDSLLSKANASGSNAYGSWAINAATVTNGVYTSRNLTINGITQDLSADRTWTVSATQTLQQVFDIETGEALMNKADTINTGSNIFNIMGSTTHSFNAMLYVTQNSTGRAMRIEGGSGLYIHPASGTEGLNVEAASGGTGAIISTTGSGAIPTWSQGYSGARGIVSSVYNSGSNQTGIVTNLELERSITSGSVANYIGESIDFKVRLIDGTASLSPIRLVGRWRDATSSSTNNGEFLMIHRRNSTNDTTLRILGTGETQLSKYVSGGSFNLATDTTNYKLTVFDASGNLRRMFWSGIAGEGNIIDNLDATVNAGNLTDNKGFGIKNADGSTAISIGVHSNSSGTLFNAAARLGYDVTNGGYVLVKPDNASGSNFARVFAQSNMGGAHDYYLHDTGNSTDSIATLYDVRTMGGGGSYTDEQAQDAVGTILVTTNTVTPSYVDATPSLSWNVNTQMSITSDASGLKLSGDASTPGNSKYYGTDVSGVKGFYDLPSGSSSRFGVTSEDNVGTQTRAFTTGNFNFTITNDGTSKRIRHEYTGNPDAYVKSDVSGFQGFFQAQDAPNFNTLIYNGVIAPDASGNNGAARMSGEGIGGSNFFSVYKDSVVIVPKISDYNSGTLNLFAWRIPAGIGTKALRYDPSTARITFSDTSTGGGAATLNDLTDVTLTSITSGDLLRYNGSQWVNVATIGNSNLTNSTISGISLGSNLANLTATDATLTFSGSYNGGTARTIGVNLGNANTWTADQSVPDEVYDATNWNGSTEVPTKNAIRDKLESITPFTYARNIITAISTTTDANFTAAAGTAYNMPSATLSTGRTINVSNLNTDGDYIELYNNETGFIWSFTGATVYDSDGSSAITELLANCNSVIRRVNGKLMISKL